VASLQFVIPKLVASALPIETVAAKARAANIDRPRLENKERHAGGHARITCQSPMARFLIDLVRVVAGRAATKGETNLVIACGLAVDAAMTAIEQCKRDGGAAPASHVEKTPY